MQGQLQAVPVSLDLGDDGGAWGGAVVDIVDSDDGVELGVGWVGCSAAADRDGGDTRYRGDTNGQCGVPDGVEGLG